MKFKKLFWIGAAAIAAAAMVACGGGNDGPNARQQLGGLLGQLEHMTVLVTNDGAHPWGLTLSMVETEIVRLSIFDDVWILPEGREHEAARTEFNDARSDAREVWRDQNLRNGARELNDARRRLASARDAVVNAQGVNRPADRTGLLHRGGLQAAVARAEELLGDITPGGTGTNVGGGAVLPFDLFSHPDLTANPPVEMGPDNARLATGADDWTASQRIAPTGALNQPLATLVRAREVMNNAPQNINEVITQRTVDGAAYEARGVALQVQSLVMPGATPLVRIGFVAGTAAITINEGVITDRVNVGEQFLGQNPNNEFPLNVPLVGSNTRFIWAGNQGFPDSHTGITITPGATAPFNVPVNMVSFWRFVDGATGQILDPQPTMDEDGIQLRDIVPAATTIGLQVVNTDATGAAAPAQAVHVSVGESRGTHFVRLFHGFTRSSSDPNTGLSIDEQIPLRGEQWASQVLELNLAGLGAPTEMLGMSIAVNMDPAVNTAATPNPNATLTPNVPATAQPFGTWSPATALAARTITFDGGPHGLSHLAAARNATIALIAQTPAGWDPTAITWTSTGGNYIGAFTATQGGANAEHTMAVSIPYVTAPMPGGTIMLTATTGPNDGPRQLTATFTITVVPRAAGFLIGFDAAAPQTPAPLGVALHNATGSPFLQNTYTVPIAGITIPLSAIRVGGFSATEAIVWTIADSSMPATADAVVTGAAPGNTASLVISANGRHGDIVELQAAAGGITRTMRFMIQQ
jgi:hypothetical protein